MNVSFASKGVGGALISKSAIEVLAHELYTSLMMRPRTTKIVALLLAVIAALVCAFGYNFVYDKNIRPEQSTLIPITEG